MARRMSLPRQRYIGLTADRALIQGHTKAQGEIMVIRVVGSRTKTNGVAHSNVPQFSNFARLFPCGSTKPLIMVSAFSTSSLFHMMPRFNPYIQLENKKQCGSKEAKNFLFLAGACGKSATDFMKMNLGCRISVYFSRAFRLAYFSVSTSQRNWRLGLAFRTEGR